MKNTLMLGRVGLWDRELGEVESRGMKDKERRVSYSIGQCDFPTTRNFNGFQMNHPKGYNRGN